MKLRLITAMILLLLTGTAVPAQKAFAAHLRSKAIGGLLLGGLAARQHARNDYIDILKNAPNGEGIEELQRQHDELWTKYYNRKIKVESDASSKYWSESGMHELSMKRQRTEQQQEQWIQYNDCMKKAKDEAGKKFDEDNAADHSKIKRLAEAIKFAEERKKIAEEQKKVQRKAKFLRDVIMNPNTTRAELLAHGNRAMYGDHDGTWGLIAYSLSVDGHERAMTVLDEQIKARVNRQHLTRKELSARAAKMHKARTDELNTLCNDADLFLYTRLLKYLEADLVGIKRMLDLGIERTDKTLNEEVADRLMLGGFATGSLTLNDEIDVLIQKNNVEELRKQHTVLLTKYLNGKMQAMEDAIKKFWNDSNMAELAKQHQLTAEQQQLMRTMEKPSKEFGGYLDAFELEEDKKPKNPSNWREFLEKHHLTAEQNQLVTSMEKASKNLWDKSNKLELAKQRQLTAEQKELWKKYSHDMDLVRDEAGKKFDQDNISDYSKIRRLEKSFGSAQRRQYIYEYKGHYSLAERMKKIAGKYLSFDEMETHPVARGMTKVSPEEIKAFFSEADPALYNRLLINLQSDLDVKKRMLQAEIDQTLKEEAEIQ